MTLGRYNTKKLRLAIMMGAAAGVIGSAAIAQTGGADLGGSPPLKLQTDYFGYSARVTSQAAYSDNINLGTDGFEDGEFFTSNILSGGAIISAPRVTGIIAGDLDFSYLVDDGDFTVSQDIGAASTFLIAENLAFFDLSGTTSRQLIGDNARFGANINVARTDQVNVHAYSASPYLFRRFSDQSSVELRYRFSQLFIPEDNTITALDGLSIVERSTAHDVLASYESGRLAERFRFRLSAAGSDTNERTNDGLTEFDFQQGSVLAEGQVVVADGFSLSGAIGYDEIDTGDTDGLFFDDDELSGFTWRAGFIASPNQRSSIRLEYGERFDDDFISASVFYDISRRLRFTASADRSFRTRAQGFGSRNRSTQASALDFADQLREGLELSPSQLIDSANQFANAVQNRSSQAIGVAVFDSASAALIGNYDRTTLTLSGFYDDTDLGFRTLESFGARLFADRRLSRRLTGTVGVDWRNTDSTVDFGLCQAAPQFFGFDPNNDLLDADTVCAAAVANSGQTNTVIGRIGARYRFYQNLSAFAEFSRAERFSDNPLLEYSENSIAAGVTLDF